MPFYKPKTQFHFVFLEEIWLPSNLKTNTCLILHFCTFFVLHAPTLGWISWEVPSWALVNCTELSWCIICVKWWTFKYNTFEKYFKPPDWWTATDLCMLLLAFQLVSVLTNFCIFKLPEQCLGSTLVTLKCILFATPTANPPINPIESSQLNIVLETTFTV